MFATVVEVNGPIDARGERELRDELDVLYRSGVRHLIFDAAKVPYINSTGLGTLLLYMDKLERIGGTLVLANLSEKALMVIEMLGFAAALDIVDSRPQAVDLISARGEA